MAAPTKVETHHPQYVLDVTGTDIDAGNNDYSIGYNQVNLNKGFSIITGTLTNMSITLLADNGQNQADVTTDLTGSPTLSANTAYFIDIRVPVKRITVRVSQSNATNEVNFVLFTAKR